MFVAAQLNQGPGPVARIVIALVLLLFLVLFLRYFNLWLRSFVTSSGISFVQLVAMSLRKVDPRVIVDSRIIAVQSGIAQDQDITTSALEAHYLAGGNVRRVVEALVAARRNGVELNFYEASAIDLAGRDVLEAVRSATQTGRVDAGM